jgi:hypothetical protein
VTQHLFIEPRTYSVSHANDKKNAREFAALVEASGWSQSEVARRISKDPSAISRICALENDAADSTLNYFKLILAQEKPDVLHAQERSAHSKPPPEEDPVRDDYAERLQRLPDYAQNTARQVLDLLDANSAEASAAIDAAVAALRAARRVGPGSSPSPQAGAPTEHKPSPKSGTGKRSTTPRPPPDRAPK